MRQLRMTNWKHCFGFRQNSATNGSEYSQRCDGTHWLAVFPACVAVLALLVFTSLGRGAEDEPWKKLSKLLLRNRGIAIGEGVITDADGVGKIEKGDKFTINGTFKPAETPTAIVATFRLKIAGKPDTELTGHELIGWDSANKTINMVSYWSDNSIERIAFDRCEGNTFFGNYSIELPGGKTVPSDVAFVFKDDGTADFNFTSGPNKGKTLSSWKWVNDTSAIEALVKTLESYGDFMVDGVWKATTKDREKVNGKWKLNGKTTKRVDRYRWIGEKKFLEISHTTDRTKGDDISVIGIDHKTWKCNLWRFGEKGARSSTMTLEKDGVWILGGRSANAEGDVVSWKVKLIKMGEDELHVVPFEFTKNGVQQEQFDVSVWTRHKD